MTQEDIIRMAREAELEEMWELTPRFVKRLERFAALVAAEREAVMQAVTDPENQPSQYGTVTLDYHFAKIKEWEDRFERMSDKALAQPPLPVQPDSYAALREEIAKWNQRKPLKDELYNELLFAVGNKYPNETRHQTALRYIKDAETCHTQLAKAIIGAKP